MPVLASVGPDSDVHVIQHGNEFLCGHADEDFDTENPADMVEHLRLHQSDGDKVPANLIPTIIQNVVDDKTRTSRREQRRRRHQVNDETANIQNHLADAGLSKRQTWWQRLVRRNP